MASGIVCTDECVSEYEKFKLQNSSKGIENRAYLLYRIADEKIVLAKNGPAEATWDDFVEDMTSDEADGAYGIFDFHAKTTDGRALEKIVFVGWAPDTIPVKKKMVYASARENFKTSLGSGLSVVIQASDLADLDQDDVQKLVLK
eukprot:CAMPEP_0181323598 /NCGR_PEP_ID=MMETSP1101-20121128/19879_1 /TAXON_ID=46948 /ORGANISM="Rhodomonas abbreviata, Strain Caron Lab Isolate" /LENGTH=144 /DNA_ID=CAMNT_0023431653 /DNA_START=67 /DNA_END=501 /DNA_ORIENTATION=+